MNMSKKLGLIVLLIILVGTTLYAGLKLTNKDDSTATTNTTTSTTTSSTAPTSEAPKTIDIGPYESCSVSTECVAVELPSIDKPNVRVTQCLNSSILTDNPGFALSNEELVELANEATCDCQQNYCGFTLK